MAQRSRYFVASFLFPALAASPAWAFPAFREHVVNPEAEVVYAVDVADINGDNKPDIVGVSATYVAWYENPSWHPHRMANKLKNDNVCLAIDDIDGDGVPEIALGADWQFNNTTGGGALFVLTHGGDPAAEWKVRTLRDPVPTLHRVRWADVDGDGNSELVVAPLKGAGSTPPHFDGKATRLFVLYPAKRYMTDDWREEPIDESLHVCHNIWPWRPGGDTRDSVLAASYEGISLFTRGESGAWSKEVLARGNDEPLPRAGAGEIKATAIAPYRLATIEPWHGNQVVVYSKGSQGWKRSVVDTTFAGGHLVYWGDFDRDGDADLVAGHREKSDASQTFGLYVYENEFKNGAQSWRKHAIDEAGIAVEDGIVADLNMDGKPDVVAGGRATHNIKYYENLGESK